MAKIFNETRKVKGRTITKVVKFYGKRWALQDGADGYVAIDVQVPDYSNDIKSLLEGNSTVTSYPVSSNVTKLNNYSLYAFPNLTRVYLFYNGVVTISDNAFIGNASLEKIYVKSSQLATYQSTYTGKWFATLFDVIIEDYTITIEPSSEVTTLTREELDAQLGLLSSAEKSSATKVVFSSEWNKASVLNLLWYYAFVGFTNLNKNIWYGTEKVDFTQFAITGDGTTALTNQAIATALTGNQYLTTIKDIKYSGFSNYDVALTYDYSALTSLEYVWTGDSRYEYDTQTQQWVLNAIYFPLNTFIANIQDKAVAYFDYTGTAPDMSAFTGWSYEWYDNASRTGNPVSMSAHKRYYLQLIPLNNSITILGSGTLTASQFAGCINQIKSSDKLLTKMIVIPNAITSIENINAVNDYDELTNLGLEYWTNQKPVVIYGRMGSDNNKFTKVYVMIGGSPAFGFAQEMKITDELEFPNITKTTGEWFNYGTYPNKVYMKSLQEAGRYMKWIYATGPSILYAPNLAKTYTQVYDFSKVFIGTDTFTGYMSNIYCKATKLVQLKSNGAKVGVLDGADVYQNMGKYNTSMNYPKLSSTLTLDTTTGHLLENGVDLFTGYNAVWYSNEDCTTQITDLTTITSSTTAYVKLTAI